MSRFVLLGLLVAAGCGDKAPARHGPSADLGVPEEPPDLTPPRDFFVGRYSCKQSIDDFCAMAVCVRDLSQALKPDAGCIGFGMVANSCGSYVYIDQYFGPLDSDGGIVTLGRIFVYDIASGQLVAVLDGSSSGTATCVAGPNVFIDDELVHCPTDAGTPQQICASFPGAPPPCGALGGVHGDKCS